MFDISWGEMLIIGVVALVVIGPKELPGVIRQVGRSIAKLRVMAGDFRAQFDDAMREAELHDVKKDFTDLKNSATSIVTDTLNPIRSDLQEAVSSVDSGVSSVVNGPASDALAASETLAAVDADARALEAEILDNKVHETKIFAPATSAAQDIPVPDIASEVVPAAARATAPTVERSREP